MQSESEVSTRSDQDSKMPICLGKWSFCDVANSNHFTVPRKQVYKDSEYMIIIAILCWPTVLKFTLVVELWVFLRLLVGRHCLGAYFNCCWKYNSGKACKDYTSTLTVGVSKKFTFRFCSMIILRCECGWNKSDINISYLKPAGPSTFWSTQAKLCWLATL